MQKVKCDILSYPKFYIRSIYDKYSTCHLNVPNLLTQAVNINCQWEFEIFGMSQMNDNSDAMTLNNLTHLRSFEMTKFCWSLSDVKYLNLLKQWNNLSTCQIVKIGKWPYIFCIKYFTQRACFSPHKMIFLRRKTDKTNKCTFLSILHLLSQIDKFQRDGKQTKNSTNHVYAPFAQQAGLFIK